MKTISLITALSVAAFSSMAFAQSNGTAPFDLALSTSCTMPVEGGQMTAESSHFTITNGEAKDNRTKLIWKRCPVNYSFISISGTSKCSYFGPGKKTFTLAEAFVQYQGMTSEINDGWRIPSIKELGSIVDETCGDRVLNRHVFPQADGMNFISSTVAAEVFRPIIEDRAGGYILTSSKSREQFTVTATEAGFLYLVKDAP